MPVLLGKLVVVETKQIPEREGTLQVNRKAGFGRVGVSGDGSGCVSLAGAVTLIETARVSGLLEALVVELSPWHRDGGKHHPGKVLLDLAVALAVGGDCPADGAVLRECGAVFGPVASAATISRVIDRLAADVDGALTAVRRARATARSRVWQLGGIPQREAADWLIVDADATVVESYSVKESAAGHYKRGFGFAPMLAYVDHGRDGTGEPVAAILRAGNANPNTAEDQIAAVELALAQLPIGHDQRVLFRADSAGCSHVLLDWLGTRKIAFSVGFARRQPVDVALEALSKRAWRPARDADGAAINGVQVAELTRLMDLSGWPRGMRVIARRERPLPGTQLRFSDTDGYRVSVFATNTDGAIADLDRRHRQRARVEDRIRAAKDTGLRNLPYQDFASNQLWCEIVSLAQDLTAWMQQLAFTGVYRVAEPKTLRLRIFNAAGRLTTSGRRLHLRLAKTWRWTPDIITSLDRLLALDSG